MAPGKVSETSGLYTAILALTLLAIVFTAGFVAYQCHSDYKTMFTIASK
ncbi:MAG: hypothetical protein JW828_04055 [Sedimentisphaerales bacterium]|nr:hypothetical protein [Sedimentisphaerales bacterium]